jgi:hypothetical protein
MATSPEWSVSDGWQCQQLISKLCYLLDHDGLDQIDDLFVAEPVVDLFGKLLTGIEPIRALFAERTVGKVIRHALSPSVIEPIGDGAEALATSYVTVFRGDRSDVPGPRPLEGPVNVVEYRDILRREAGVWRIARRTIEMVFLKQA